jgi:ParB family chromosome partitioning protein
MADDKNKKGLGRGLMSLFGDQSNELPPKQNMNASYLSVSIGDLARNQFQPRNYFDEKKIEELAQSIKKNGLIQPIAVRKGKKNEYEIVAGERRWLAAQKAGLHEVPVVVLELNDTQSLELAIIENIQLIKEFNYNHDKLSDFMGKSRSHISNTLRLLSLPLDVIKLVDEGKLSAGQVRPLVGRHNASGLAHSILKEKLSARSIENLVRREKEFESNKLKSPFNKTDPNVLLAQRQIEESLGLETKIISRKDKSGKVIIEYGDIDQFEMLQKKLIKKPIKK